MIDALWALEPVVLTLLGSATFWPLLFTLLHAIGHPLSDQTEDALLTLGVFVAGAIIRSRVVPASGATLPPGTTITAPSAIGPTTQSPITVTVGMTPDPFTTFQRRVGGPA